MAIQVESPAQLTEIGAVFRRRRWWVLVPLLFSIGLGALVAEILPNKYEVETQVKLLEVRYDDEQHFRTRGQQGALERNLVNAEYDVKEPSRIHRLIDELAWVDFQELDALEKQEYVEMVQGNLEVTVLPKTKDEGSNYVELSYRDIDPNRAEAFLRRLTVMWVDEVFNLDKDEIASKVKAQRELVESNERTLDQLRSTRREKLDANQLPFDATKRTRDGLNNDNVYNRLIEAEDELIRLGIELMELEARRDAIKSGLDDMQPYVLQSSLSAGVSKDDGLLTEILNEIEKVDAALANMRSSNTRYETLRKTRAELVQKAEARTGGTAATQIQERVPNPDRLLREADLRAAEEAIALMELRMGALETQRQVDMRLAQRRSVAAQELDKIEKDIFDTERTLGERRAELAGLEGDIAGLLQLGPSYEITKEPLAPTDPSEPNVVLVMIGAIVIGLLIGVLLAMAREYLVSGFRLPSDVGSDIAVPILGIVGEVTTRRQRNTRRALASATTISTVLFLGLVIWFLDTWRNERELLGSDLVERVEQIQYSLR